MPRRVRGFNPPPGWPEPPHPGWWPPSSWTPSPEWPEPPDDWEWWREQEVPTALDQLRGLRRWQKGALAGAVLVPVVLMGQAFVRTALLPGDPGFFSGVEYTDGYEAGWEHAKAFPSRPEGLCSLKAARVPDYETDAESFDWQLGYLKGCHDGRKD